MQICVVIASSLDRLTTVQKTILHSRVPFSHASRAQICLILQKAWVVNSNYLMITIYGYFLNMHVS